MCEGLWGRFAPVGSETFWLGNSEDVLSKHDHLGKLHEIGGTTHGLFLNAVCVCVSQCQNFVCVVDAYPTIFRIFMTLSCYHAVDGRTPALVEARNSLQIG